MDPHAMGMQQGSSGLSMPMSSMGMQQDPGMSMSMGAVYPQQQMMLSMQQQQMPMSSMAMNQMSAGPSQQQQQQQQSADWRMQLTREHRANLIAKIYNEMVRVSADPVPGIKLWMNVSWYELSLYKESPTQEVYINKIFTRLKSLRAQQSDMNAAMAAQALPNQGMLSRLDFSYYNTLNLSQRGSNAQVSSYPGHGQFSGPGPHPGAQQQQQPQSQPTSATSTPVKTEANVATNSAAEYWQQHAALRAKHQGDVEKVHSAFKKYVDHMKGHDETEQKKKLRYLLSYVELCANILSEDKATHPARKIEELDKVFKYIVKIVNPYLKKLRTETDKRSYPTADGSSGSVGPSGQSTTSAGPTSSGAPTSSGSSTMPTGTSSGFSSAMTQSQPAGQSQQQTAVNTSASMQQTPQQKQQQYLMQQRAQQMQQQQQMQAQARQQQMMQQQQMMRQQQMQQKPQQQQQYSAQQASQVSQQQQQNSQNAANQQSGQQTQQQMGQQLPTRPQQGHQPQQNSVQQQRPPPQPQKPQQPPQTQPQPQQSQQPQTSRGDSPSINAGLSLGLDDSLYGSMGNDLLQMPTPSGTSSGLMDFSSALSPTSFGGMDLLDWDDGTDGQGTPGTSGTSGGDSADLMTFVQTL